MAYLRLQETADYSVHESLEVETGDHDDHSFNGIMFDVEVKSLLPVEYLEISSVAVRGALGPMTVWTTRGGHDGKLDKKALWEKVFDAKVAPNMYELTPLEFEKPVRVRPGEKLGLYVHSARMSDDALVYDDQRSDTSHEDRLLKIHPGAAHISPRIFDPRGYWGWAWRPHREFVGRLSHGVRYLMWKPSREVNAKFPRRFRRGAFGLVSCFALSEGAMRRLPFEVAFYILNLCPWDWFGALEEGEDDAPTPAQEDEGRPIGWGNGDYRRRIEEHARRSFAAETLFGHYHHSDDDEDDEDDDDEDFEGGDSGEDDEDDDDDDDDDEGDGDAKADDNMSS